MRSRRCQPNQWLEPLAWVFLFAVFLLPTASFAQDQRQDADEPPRHPRSGLMVENFEIGGETFTLELAADAAARGDGLMGRASLGEHEGMIFIYSSGAVRRYWMGNCLIDLDIAYLDPTGKIITTYEMPAEPPKGRFETEPQYDARMPRYSSIQPAQFAIELKRGTLRRLGLKRGDTIEFDRKRLADYARTGRYEPPESPEPPEPPEPPEQPKHTPPDDIPDYRAQLTELSASYQPQGKNGWPAFAAVLEDVGRIVEEAATRASEAEPPADFDLEKFIRNPPDPDTTWERFAIQRMEEEQIFQRMALALEAPRFVPDWSGDGPLWLEEFPELAQSRDFVRIVIGRLRDAGRRGDAVAMIENARLAYASAEAIGSVPTAFHQMVSTSLFIVAVMDIRQIIEHVPLTHEHCRGIVEWLTTDATAPVEDILRGELLIALDSVDRVHTDEHDGSYYASKESLDAFGIDMPAFAENARRLATREHNRHVLNAFFERAIAEAKHSPVVRANEPYDFDTALQRLFPAHVFATMFVRSVRRQLLTDGVVRAITRGVAINAAVRGFKADAGRFPESLDELGAGWFEAPPRDPLHGGRYIYRRITTESGEQDYILYSTGIDGIDDDGKRFPPERGALIEVLSVPDTATGYDYVIHAPPDGE